MDLVGITLGQFEIVEQVGKGGMATVYKAYQASLQRHVALKVLLPTLAEDTDLVRRFLREARSAAALHHPNVIVIHDVGSQENIHYIVAEYLEGVTLAQLLDAEDGALPLDRVLHIVRQVSSALDYAHARGYVHRDIKPSNIMVDPAREDHVTLMDFGLVQVTGESRITRTGFIMGTPDYMSPEQAKGEDIDRRTDIYSLGVTAYHMLTGGVPFAKPTPHAILMAHIMEAPPPMSAPPGDTPPGVEAVVLKALAKDPRDRYEWAGEMVSDFELVLSASGMGDVLPWAAPAEERAPGPSTTLEAAIPKTPPLGTVDPRAPPGGPSFAPSATQAPGPPLFQDSGSPPSGLPVQTPPGGIPARSVRPRWVWPVVGAAALAFVAVLVVLGILLAPSILQSLPSAARQTLTAQVFIAPAQTPTSPPEIEQFSVSPTEIVAGQSVDIEWRVSGSEPVSIRPGILDEGPTSGRSTHQPTQTTIYELILANGKSRTVEVVVRPAPVASATEPLQVEPTPTWATATATPTATSTVAPAATPTATSTVAPTATPLALADTPTPTTIPPTKALPTKAPPTQPLPKPAATSTAAPGEGVLISFEQWGTWTRGEQPYGELTQTQEQVHSGDHAARLSYQFPESEQDFVVFRQPTAIGGEPNAISVWVYGDGSGHFLNVWIQDAKTQVWAIHLGRVGAAGWQQLTGMIDPGRPWPSGHVYGPQDEVIDYPIRFYGIVLDRPAAGPLQGTIYLDELSVGQVEGPPPGETPGPGGPAPSSSGRIVFTVQVEDRYTLYATDPGWDRMVKLGDTDWAHSTCAESNVAATLEGLTLHLLPVERCSIAGTVDSCPSPNGQFKVNTSRKGNDYQVTLWRTSDNVMLEAIYTGPLNIHPGINWSLDSSHFLFTIGQSVYRADVDRAGYRQILPFKHDTWPLQYTPDGTYIYYLKPVSGAISDVFLARPDGSSERNLTNSPIAIKLCPRWRQ